MTTPARQTCVEQTAKASSWIGCATGIGPYLELAKIQLTAMVLVTTAVGYVVGSPGTLDWERMFWTLLGTGLSAAGANAFNQLLEVRRDVVMQRTCSRPLPSGRIPASHAIFFALATSAAGVALLHELVNPLTALLGFVNIAVYALIYTPLKPRTPLCTFVGALCGALPPVMGGTGAAGGFSLDCLFLGAILFVWQIPHFLALAWLYRQDYARAGFRMLPVIDSQGHRTCRMIVFFSLALLPIGLAGMLAGVAGRLFGLASLVLGIGLLLLAIHLHREKTPRNARRVFMATLAYLPLLMVFLIVDGYLRSAPRQNAVVDADPTVAAIQAVPAKNAR